MKIVTIIGARPQFIKAATISRVIKDRLDLKEVIIHTGQHFDKNMSDVFFEQMDIPKPDYNLNINGLGHGAMTGQMLEEIEKVLLQEQPDWVLVYGDTNSTLAGALAAKKLHIRVAHVEAGLRSFNIKMPEEVNRILTDRISDVLFCPTETAISNLEKEGFNDFSAKIINVGDVMYDAALFYEQKKIKPEIKLPTKYVLTTIHRAENTDDVARLTSIIEALKDISKTIPIVIPIHPRTRKIIEKSHFTFDESNLILIDPVGYLEMVYLIENSTLIMTDSGGLQKEAFFFGKRCITMRDETEWVELIEGGYNVTVGANKDKIVTEFNNSLTEDIQFGSKLYGNGDAANKIVNALAKYSV
jgi:UDP-GlcNAc3NAcA epimerase